MKKYLDHVPVVVLLISAALTFAIPEKSAYQIALVASFILFAYQQWLFKQESPDFSIDIKELYKKIDKVWDAALSENQKMKSDIANEMTSLKDDIGKMSMSLTKVPGVSAPREKQRIQF